MAKKKKKKIKSESFSDFTHGADSNFSKNTQGSCNKVVYADDPGEDEEETDIMKMIDTYNDVLKKLESKEKKCQAKKKK